MHIKKMISILAAVSFVLMAVSSADIQAEDDDAIYISDVEGLKGIVNDLDGKYALEKDIIFTDNDGIGFKIRIEWNYDANAEEMTFTLTKIDTEEELPISSGEFWFGEAHTDQIDDGTITFSDADSGFDISEGAMFTAGGTDDGTYAVCITIGAGESNGTSEEWSQGNFEPIGYTNARSIGDVSDIEPFTGTFDGRGYKIIGLEIAVFSNDITECAGLFGYVGVGATISSVHMEGGRTLMIAGDGTSYSYTGGVIGLAENVENMGTIMVEKCYNHNEIIVRSPNAQSQLGGIMGGGINVSMMTVEECFNAGDISCRVIDNISFSGGIVGYVIDNNEFKIRNCSNIGNTSVISESLRTDQEYQSAGGIIGKIRIHFQYTNIEECFNSGNTLNITKNRNGASGGIIGYSDITNGADSWIQIKRSYNEGSVETSSEGFSLSGGIVGYARAEYGKMDIEECYNIGEIYASSSDGAYTGGIAAIFSHQTYSMSYIKNCYNAGDIFIDSPTAYGGGISGLFSSQEIGYAILQNCYNVGNINSDSVNASSGSIVGNITRSIIMNAYFLDQGLDVYGSATGSTIYFEGEMVTNEDQLTAGALTEEEMKKRESFFQGTTSVNGIDYEGWAFGEEEVWSIIDDMAYPYLTAIETRYLITMVQPSEGGRLWYSIDDGEMTEYSNRFVLNDRQKLVVRIVLDDGYAIRGWNGSGNVNNDEMIFPSVTNDVTISVVLGQTSEGTEDPPSDGSGDEPDDIPMLFSLSIGSIALLLSLLFVYKRS